MSISVIEGEYGAVMYCNTTNWAFGPVFESADRAWEFRKWCDDDPRKYSDSELESKYINWRQTRGLPFESKGERKAFAEWLSNGLSNYDKDVLEKLHTEWKRAVWE